MKTFWLFRSNLRILENYHKYTTLESFEKHCWDFYLLQGIQFLRDGKFDEVVIWRLQPKRKQKDIVFEVNGGKFIQRFVDSFTSVMKGPSADVSFFRGGFKEYCELTKLSPDKFGLKLYLGAGKRVKPQYGGEYDKILVESNDEKNRSFDSLFYKVPQQTIFKPLNVIKKYDICWMANFKASSMQAKGQPWFMELMRKSPQLKQLKILHVGDGADKGRQLAKSYGLSNITFNGYVERCSPELNNIINTCRLGLVTSSRGDGCPRTMTEFLSAGLPLLLREDTRLIDFYRGDTVIEFNETNYEKKIINALNDYPNLYEKTLRDLEDKLTMRNICKLNLEEWL